MSPRSRKAGWTEASQRIVEAAANDRPTHVPRVVHGIVEDGIGEEAGAGAEVLYRRQLVGHLLGGLHPPVATHRVRAVAIEAIEGAALLDDDVGDATRGRIALEIEELPSWKAEGIQVFDAFGRIRADAVRTAPHQTRDVPPVPPFVDAIDELPKGDLTLADDAEIGLEVLEDGERAHSECRPAHDQRGGRALSTPLDELLLSRKQILGVESGLVVDVPDGDRDQIRIEAGEVRLQLSLGLLLEHQIQDLQLMTRFVDLGDDARQPERHRRHHRLETIGRYE